MAEKKTVTVFVARQFWLPSEERFVQPGEEIDLPPPIASDVCNGRKAFVVNEQNAEEIEVARREAKAWQSRFGSSQTATSKARARAETGAHGAEQS